jgi:apolipoprotein N-acyltransferase
MEAADIAQSARVAQPRDLADLLRNSITVIWFVLIVATLFSWWMGTDHGFKNEDLVGSLVLLVAFIKVRFVGLYFMEHRHSPIPLRIIFEAWCLVVCSAVIGMFLFV